MKSFEIRNKFINFFKEKGHENIPSASLIPENDPTLLFVNSGMFPLVPYLLGEKHPKGKRLVNFQKSFRTDDIEEIGDNRHNTFFEMLGNWSLGDYFKKDQLEWWFEFLIKEIKLDPNKIYQTVHVGDDKILKDNESIKILKNIYQKYGINAEEGPETIGKGEFGPGLKLDFSKFKIFAYKDKNWWKRGDAIGELGGPDSETFYDTNKEHNSKFGAFCHLNCDCGRFLEIGNSVFMQYQKTENGWKELKNKNVDFGGGLERITMISEGLDNIFETDLFQPIILKIEELSGKRYKEMVKEFEIISDHIRAATFIIGDERGIAPSNKQQGYFVRRLLRRAIRYGDFIGITSVNWLNILSEKVIEIYEDIYPELRKNSEFIFHEIQKEEKRFRLTLNKGLKEFEKLSNKKIISGKEAFNLYQTYGFPIEMIIELANEKKQEINQTDFKRYLEDHKKISQTSSVGLFKSGLVDVKEKTIKLHTATHLLLSSLRKILGEEVLQKGSNINSERLRFDFSFSRKLTTEEIQLVENNINDIIKKDLDIVTEEMTLEEAIKSGALAFFNEKYPDIVKVYSIKDSSGNIYSKEICHGPHIKKTSEIGILKIIKEEASSSGIRRIKAVIK